MELGVLLGSLDPNLSVCEVSVRSDFRLVSEYVATLLFQRVSKGECVDPPFPDRDVLKRSLLHCLEWPEFRKHAFSQAVERLSSPDCTDGNWKWYLQICGMCWEQAKPPDSIVQLWKDGILSDRESAQILVKWALVYVQELDVNIWIAFNNELLNHIMAGYKPNARKLLELSMELHFSLSKFDFFQGISREYMESITDDIIVDVIAKSIAKIIAGLRSNIPLLRKLDTTCVKHLKPMLDLLCFCADRNLRSVQVCQCLLQVLNSLYEFLVRYVTEQDRSAFAEPDEFLRLLGMNGLQKSTSGFINRVQLIDNDQSGAAKKQKRKVAGSAFAAVVPKLVQSSDQLECLLLRRVCDPSVMKRHFKLSTCRDFRINRREFALARDKKINCCIKSEESTIDSGCTENAQEPT